MAKFYYESTKNIETQITNIYNFLWPTSAALWNFRWQVAGYLSIRPDADVKELAGRFVYGSELPGVDYKNPV